MQYAALFRAIWNARPFGRFAIACMLVFALCPAVSHADEYADVRHLAAQGRVNEALAKAAAYIASKPRDPQMRFLRGVILSEQGRRAEAIQAFIGLTQEFPELPEPYNNLAALYAAQSQLDQARAALEKAIQLNPGYATAHENLGDVYMRLAAQSYERAQQLEPSNGSVAPKLRAIRELTAPKTTGPKPSATTAPIDK